MGKNRIVAKNKRPKSNLATGRDYSKDKVYQSSKKRRNYRASLNKEARRLGIYGKRYAMGKDLSHTKSGGMVLESRAKNRARNRGKK